MSFFRYAKECKQLVLELKALLSPADVEELRKDCSQLGIGGWDEWFFDHLDAVSAFMTATTSERERKKGWQEPVQKRRLVLAAIQQLTRACNLLEGVHRHGLGPGQSSRKIASKAADAYLDIFLKQPASDWPFEAPDPFNEE